jgi:hypothetical protein
MASPLNAAELECRRIRQLYRGKTLLSDFEDSRPTGWKNIGQPAGALVISRRDVQRRVWFAMWEAIACLRRCPVASVLVFTSRGWHIEGNLEDKTPSEPLYEVAETDTPLMCQGPEIGV